MFDLDRIEVLRGPQGTLYGRNTTGGAIKFISARPTEETEARIRGQFARFDSYKVEGMLSGAFSEKVRARVAVVKDGSKGAIYNTLQDERENGSDAIAYRAMLDVDVTDRFSAEFTVFGGQNDTESGRYRMQPTVTASGAEDVDGSLGCPVGCTDLFGQTAPAGFWTVDTPFEGRLDIKTFGAMAKFIWDLDSFTITAVSGYQDLDKVFSEDTDTGAVNFVETHINVKSWAFSEELQIAGSTDNAEWIVGGFYLKEDLDQDQPLDIGREFRPLIESIDPVSYPGGFDPVGAAIGVPSFLYRTVNNQKTETMALFGQYEYALTDRIQLMGGVRYTHETKDFEQVAVLEEPGFTVPLFSFPEDAAELDGNQSWNEFSWKVGLSFRPTDTSLVYANVSTAFKSGGYNGGFIGLTAPNPVDEQQPYDPENVTAYEIGLKTELADGRVRLNVAAFYTDYKDIQVFETFVGVLPYQQLVNAEGASIKGVEFEVQARPIDGLDLMFSGALLDAEIDEAVSAFGGNRMVQAPKLSLNGLARYEWELTGTLAASVQVDASYQSEVFFNSDNNPLLRQEGYWLVNGNVALINAGSWEVSLFAKNIFAKKYFIHGFALGGFGVNQLMFGERASYGVGVSFDF